MLGVGERGRCRAACDCALCVKGSICIDICTGRPDRVMYYLKYTFRWTVLL